MCSQVSPMRSSAPGAKFSTSTSQLSINRSRMALPFGCLESMVIDRLLWLSIVKYRLSAFGTSRSCPRVMSPIPGRSILITSAPNQASNCVQVGPDCTWVKSRMRTPSSAFPACPQAFALGAGQRSPFAFGFDLATIFGAGLALALRLTETFFAAALLFTLLLFQCVAIASAPSHLYIVWFLVPGAYSFGSTQTLITADLPVLATCSRAVRKAGAILEASRTSSPQPPHICGNTEKF